MDPRRVQEHVLRHRLAWHVVAVTAACVGVQLGLGSDLHAWVWP